MTKSSHLKVQVWVHTKNSDGGDEVLLLETNEKRGCFWQPITGSVEPNEEPLSAALREAKEETGFSFESKPLSLEHEFEFTESRGGSVLESCYMLQAPAKYPPRIDPREHRAWKWVSIHEAFSMLKYESNRLALQRLEEKLR